METNRSTRLALTTALESIRQAQQKHLLITSTSYNEQDLWVMNDEILDNHLTTHHKITDQNVALINQKELTEHDTPLALMSSTTSDPDCPKYWQIDSLPDSANWKASIQKEFDSLYQMKVWDIVPEDSATSEILNAFILLKKKRDTLGEITAYKSRFCIKGNEQNVSENDQYFAPVCNQRTLMVIVGIYLVIM